MRHLRNPGSCQALQSVQPISASIVVVIKELLRKDSEAKARTTFFNCKRGPNTVRVYICCIMQKPGIPK